MNIFIIMTRRKKRTIQKQQMFAYNLNHILLSSNSGLPSDFQYLLQWNFYFLCLQNINDWIQHGWKNRSKRQVDDPGIRMYSRTHSKCDYYREEVDYHQREMSGAGFKGFCSFMSCGNFSQNTTNTNVTGHNEYKREPHKKHW